MASTGQVNLTSSDLKDQEGWQLVPECQGASPGPWVPGSSPHLPLQPADLETPGQSLGLGTVGAVCPAPALAAALAAAHRCAVEDATCIRSSSCSPCTETDSVVKDNVIKEDKMVEELVGESATNSLVETGCGAPDSQNAQGREGGNEDKGDTKEGDCSKGQEAKVAIVQSTRIVGFDQEGKEQEETESVMYLFPGVLFVLLNALVVIMVLNHTNHPNQGLLRHMSSISKAGLPAVLNGEVNVNSDPFAMSFPPTQHISPDCLGTKPSTLGAPGLQGSPDVSTYPFNRFQTRSSVYTSDLATVVKYGVQALVPYRDGVALPVRLGLNATITIAMWDSFARKSVQSRSDLRVLVTDQPQQDKHREDDVFFGRVSIPSMPPPFTLIWSGWLPIATVGDYPFGAEYQYVFQLIARGYASVTLTCDPALSKLGACEGARPCEWVADQAGGPVYAVCELRRGWYQVKVVFYGQKHGQKHGPTQLSLRWMVPGSTMLPPEEWPLVEGFLH